MGCNISRELLEQYRLDQLSEDECVKLEMHIPDCEACIDQLSEIDAVISLVHIAFTTEFLSEDPARQPSLSEDRPQAPKTRVPSSIQSRYVC